MPRGHITPETTLLGEVARQLGLTLTPGTLTTAATLTGTLDEHAVKVTGAPEDEAFRLGLRADFVTPLDLGLRVRRRNTLSMIAVGFGDPSQFHLEFDVEADEPPRAEALLVPSLQSALLASGALIDDLGIESGVVGPDNGGLPTLPTADETGEALKHLVSLVSLAEQSCLGVPEASALAAHASSWAALASKEGLELRRTPLHMKGRIKRSLVDARVLRSGPHSYSVSVTAGFDSPLGVGLSIRRENIVDKLVSLIKPELRFADRVFDPLYLVHAEDRKTATRIIDAETRSLLSGLAHRKLDPHLWDEAIELQFPSEALSTDECAEVIGQVATIANRVQDNALGLGRNGPYR